MGMKSKKDRARGARQKVDSMQGQDDVYQELTVPSEFIGYDTTQLSTTIEAIIEDKKLVEQSSQNEVLVVLAKTPCYGESGGQIADQGTIQNESIKAEVLDDQKAPMGHNLHRIKDIKGRIKVGKFVDVDI